MSRWRVTQVTSETVLVYATTAEEAKMLAWMRTNRAVPVSLSVTHEATLESSE